MWKYVKTSLLIGTATATRLLTLVVRMKCLAAWVGPGGLGLLAQGSQLLICGSAITSQGIGTAMVKYLANETERADVVQAALTLQKRIVVPFALLIAGFAWPLAHGLLADGGLWPFLVWVALAIVFANLAAVWESGLVGMGRLAGFVISRIGADVIGLLVLLGLLWRWGLAGAFSHLAAGAVVGCVLSWVVFRARRLASSVATPSFDQTKPWERILVSYSAWLYLSLLLEAGTALLIRSRVVHQLGAEANGLYHLAVALTSMVIPFMTNPLWSRLFVQMSQLQGDLAGLGRELDHAMRYCLAVTGVMLVAILLARRPLILLVATPEFSTAETLIPAQCVGILGYVLNFLFGVSLWARGLVRQKCGFDLLSAGIWIVGAVAGLQMGMGLVAIPVWYAVGQLVGVVAQLAYHAIRLQYVPSLPLRWGMVSTGLVLGLTAWIG